GGDGARASRASDPGASFGEGARLMKDMGDGYVAATVPDQQPHWQDRLGAWLARPKVQAWAARTPLIRNIVRREGDAMMDVVSGFVHAQVLSALVQLDLFERLKDGPLPVDYLAREAGMSVERMSILLRAVASLKLLRKVGADRYGLSFRGAALAGVPGLQAMIRHHDVFYQDMADPLALLRGEVDTGLAGFWPYVFGAGAVDDPEQARTYSDLMADSQGLVADDTLDTVSLKGVRHLMDVGGGTGAFLSRALQRYPDLRGTILDLPDVVFEARAKLEAAGLRSRVSIQPDSFRDADLPKGADAISLVRVLYDHADHTVADLLAKCFAALPSGGRLIVSEPMASHGTPERAGDCYFAFYCMAMQTGKARCQAQVAEALRAAGFTKITSPKSRRPFVTSVVTAQKP
ncbi:MAG: methyltransferase, partial [Pseudomonadota bacterium]